MASTKLYHTDDTDLQQQQHGPDETLLQSPQLPPRNGTAAAGIPPYVENQNIFRVLLKNRRQISSLAAGKYFCYYICPKNVYIYVCMYNMTI